MVRFQHPRMDALGHNLPEDVQWLIFSFERHPTAVLIKSLRFTYQVAPYRLEFEPWRRHGGVMLTVSGARVFTNTWHEHINISELHFFHFRPDFTTPENHFGIDRDEDLLDVVGL